MYVKTYYATRSTIDYEINRDAKGLSIVSVSIATDNAGGIYATVVFEEKKKPAKKKGGEG